MIAIAGATGNVGRPLTAALAAGGRDVRVLTRDASNVVEDAAQQEVAVVDFDDHASLRAAFRGAETAFVSNGTSARQVRDEKALLDAAVAEGVEHIVELSVGGAGSDNPMRVLRWHTEIDEYLAGLDVGFTIIRPATYIKAVVQTQSGFIRSGNWGGHTGDGRAAFMDTDDVARFAARVILEGVSLHESNTYDITGPESLSMKAVATLLSQASASHIVYHQRSTEDQAKLLAAAGLPDLYVDVLTGLDDLTRENVFGTPTSTFADVTGLAARPVSDWISANAGRLLQVSPTA